MVAYMRILVPVALIVLLAGCLDPTPVLLSPSWGCSGSGTGGEAAVPSYETEPRVMERVSIAVHADVDRLTAGANLTGQWPDARVTLTDPNGVVAWELDAPASGPLGGMQAVASDSIRNPMAGPWALELAVGGWNYVDFRLAYVLAEGTPPLGECSLDL